MAQAMTTTAGARVNRRFLFLGLILAALSAVLVYAAISRSDGGGTGTVGDVPVVVAKAAIPAGTRITVDMVEVRLVADGGLPAGVLSSTDAAVGQVARQSIIANEQVLLSKLVGTSEAFSNDALSYIIEGGVRGMAIDVQAVVGAGGLVLPGDYVDVLWIPDEALTDFEGAGLVAENVEVLAVQQTLVELPPSAPGVQEEGEGVAPSTAGDQRVRGFDEEPLPEASTVTLMLTSEQAARVFCADEGGVLRLAVRAFGDASPSGLPPATCTVKAKVEE